MRRNDREITERGVIDDIIRRCKVCRLGMCDNGHPYIVPLSFGYDGRVLYFHAATEGRKLEILKRDDRVCFEFDLLHEVSTSDDACSWGMKYESVVGSGRAEFVVDPRGKSAALECIMAQYSTRHWHFTPEQLEQTAVIRVTIGEVTGKARL